MYLIYFCSLRLKAQKSLKCERTMCRVLVTVKSTVLTGFKYVKTGFSQLL